MIASLMMVAIVSCDNEDYLIFTAVNEKEVKFQNEFLLAKSKEGNPIAMTPDLICLLDLETGQPITTEQIRYGFRVLVFGLSCDPQWRTKHGLECSVDSNKT